MKYGGSKIPLKTFLSFICVIIKLYIKTTIFPLLNIHPEKIYLLLNHLTPANLIVRNISAQLVTGNLPRNLKRRLPRTSLYVVISTNDEYFLQLYHVFIA